MAVSKSTTDQAKEMGRAAEAGRDAMTDAARRGAQTAEQMARSGMNAMSEGAQRFADQFSATFGLSNDQTQELAEQSSKAVAAMSQCGTVLAKGYQDISREWLQLAQEGMRRNLEALSEFSRCRTLPELVNVQGRLMRESMEDILANSRRIAERSMQLASEATETLTRNAEQSYRRAA
jgi:phasin family protein